MKKTIKIKLLDKIIFFLLNLISKNKYGLVSGWWQCWKYDKLAFDYINKKHPTKKMWLTKDINISFYRQICDTYNLVCAASDVAYSESEKGELKATFTLSFWIGSVMMSAAVFQFIEKEHNYCIQDNLINRITNKIKGVLKCK